MVTPSGQPESRWYAGARPRRSVVFGTVLALVGATLSYPLLSGSPASAAGARLPGGTSISVTVDGPTEGQAIPPGTVIVNGRATLGSGGGTPTTALIYALDMSNESDDASHGGASRICSDADSILVCEKRYANQLNSTAVLANSISKVGVIGYGTSATMADVGPARNLQFITGLNTRTSDRSGTDAMVALNSAVSNQQQGGSDGFPASLFSDFTRLFVGDGRPGRPTNLGDAIRQSVSEAGFAAQPSTIVALMSRGVVSDPGDVSAALGGVPGNVHFYTFAVGRDASCGGSLQEIADRTGGQCVAPENPNDGRRLGPLQDLLQHLMDSQLDSVGISVDGGPTVPVDQAFSSDSGGAQHFLPLPGPVTAFWHSSLTGLASGQQHSVCVTANGRDAGGPGSVSECRTFVIDVPPSVDPGGPYSGLQDNQIPVSGTVSDPDSGNVTTQWAIRAGEGVDAEASCTIGDAAALSTTVSCDSPGTYTLTLTANDGAAAPVTVGTTVTVTNVPPAVSAGGPYTGTAEIPVELTGTVTDPDSPELVTIWSVSPPPGSEPPAGETTGGETTGGETTGGETTGGETTGGETTGGETTGGETTGGETTGGDPAGPAPCAFTDPTALVTTITCPTPGDYTLTLTVNDGDNPPVVVTTTLKIVPKTVPVGSLSVAGSVTPAIAYVGGDPILVTYTVRNSGNIPMAGIRLTTELPAALANAVPAPAILGSAGGAPCRAGAACDLGTLQPGQQRTIRFVVRPGTKVDARITATLTTTGPDTTAADNKASVRVLVRQPELLVDPTTGPPGLVVQASGHGFPAGAIIKLAWSVGGTQLPGQLVVGRDGAFNTQVLVFNHDDDGPRVLVATPVRGPRFGPVESNSFLVATPGQQPPFDH